MPSSAGGARATLRVLLILVSLALCARAAAAADLFTDLDRDGVRDTISIQAQGSLTVRLSATKSLFRLRTLQPIVSITTADIDGDGRVELLAADASAGLHIWRRTAHGKLRRYHPRPILPRAGTPRHGTFDKSPDAVEIVAQTDPGATHPFDILRAALQTPLVVFGAHTYRTAALTRDRYASPRQPRAPPSVV